MVSDKQIRLAGGALALGFTLGILTTVVRILLRLLTFLFSDTFVGRMTEGLHVQATLEILVEQAELVQTIGLTRIGGGILVLVGILMLERATRDGSGAAFLRMVGALCFTISIVLLVIRHGLDLAGVHVLGSVGISDVPVNVATAQAGGLALASSGVALSGGIVGLIGSATLHFGLSRRNLFRHSSTVSLIVGIISVLTLVMLVFSNYVTVIVVEGYTLASVIGMVVRFWLLFIGVMMYRKGDEILDG